VPIFLFRRNGYEEDRLMAQGEESLGMDERCIEELADRDKKGDGFDRISDMFQIYSIVIKEMVL
jgi:hypothetical protein